MSRLTKGLVQVYTGDGKGKSTAAWGQALRAAGRGLRVCIVMLLKGDADLGEVNAAAALGDLVTVRQFGASRADLAARTTGEWWKAGFNEDDRRHSQDGLDFARDAVMSGDYDLVVIDEANVAMGVGAHGGAPLLDVEEMLEMLRDKPPHVEIILTGRNAPPEVVAAADLVTEMRAVKHPFDRGVDARRGIDY